MSLIAAEIARVREHLHGAEAFARGRSSDGLDLDPAQRLTRALLLDELARYREEGVFPKNHDSRVPRPAFIDEHGTRCAMAHLMELGGAGELVAEVARTNNHAFVEELARDARVIAWLRAAGLSVEEAARIQPQYCETPADCMCALATDRSAVWEGTVVESGSGGTKASKVRIDVVHRQYDPVLGLTISAEDVIDVWQLLPVGSRLIASTSRVVATIEDGGVLGKYCLGTMNGIQHGFPTPITQTKAIELTAKTPSECVAMLSAESALWVRRVCEGMDPSQPSRDAPPPGLVSTNDETPRGDDDGGCSISLASSSPESVSVLLAVLSALAVRRSVRRRSAGR